MALDYIPKRLSLPGQVAHRIEELILNESFKVGDKLPSERDLAEEMGVSRGVIRESIGVLSDRGFVEIKPGSGTFIKMPTHNEVTQPLGRFIKMHSSSTFDNILEVREALESSIVQWATERANETDIYELEKCIHEMEQHASNPEIFTESDLEFHQVLARATKNEIYMILLKPISALLLEFRQHEYFKNRKEAIEGGLIHHKKILECVKNKDGKAAKLAMINHLNQARELYMNHNGW